MELKRADVCLLVLLLLGETLLELTVLLEPVLLGHLALLVIGLHHSALRAEVLHLAIEYGILAELTLQRTVVDRYLYRRLQTYLLETLLAVAENPRLVAHELMLEPLTYHLVRAKEVGSGYTLAIRRVAHDDALLRRTLEVLEVGLLHGDVAGETCGPHVHACRVHGLDVYVVAVYVVLELTLLRVVIVYAVEEFLIEVGPTLESELLAEYARAHVVGYEGGLYEQRARAAHRVYEVGVALPSRHEYHAGGQHLVERSLHGLLPIAAAVERLAARVERERGLVLGYVYVETYVGVAHGDVGTRAGVLTKLVYYGILHLVCHEA